MAYPFIKWPTLKEFVDKAKREFGAKETTVSGTLIGPRGPVTVVALEREGKCAVLPDDDGQRLTPTMLRSLCNRLGMSLEPFGFTIGDWMDGPDTLN